MIVFCLLKTPKFAFIHRGLFANPAKPLRCTTEPVRPQDGINKDVSSAKLLLTNTSVHHVDCTCSCPLLKTQNHCLCPNESCNPPSASPHPSPIIPPTHPLIDATCDITVAVKNLAQNPTVLAT